MDPHIQNTWAQQAGLQQQLWHLENSTQYPGLKIIVLRAGDTTSTHTQTHTYTHKPESQHLSSLAAYVKDLSKM